VGEAVEERGGEFLVSGEDLDPFSEGEIRGEQDAAFLVAFGQEVEEQLAAGRRS